MKGRNPSSNWVSCPDCSEGGLPRTNKKPYSAVWQDLKVRMDAEEYEYLHRVECLNCGRLLWCDGVTNQEIVLGIESTGICQSHNLVYHDGREEWLCPFCDL